MSCSPSTPPELQFTQVLGCEGSELRLEVTGASFLVSPEGPPTVTLGGLPAVVASNDCEALGGGLTGWRRCRRLALVVPGTLPAGSHRLTVTNPGAAECGRTATLDVSLPPRPLVLSVEPSVCPGDARLRVSGVDLWAQTQVRLGDRVAERVEVFPGGELMEATFSDLEPGLLPLRVDFGSACAATSLSVQVEPGPWVQAVVPSLVLASAATRVTLLGVALGTVATVELEWQGFARPRIPVAFTQAPGSQTRLTFDVPARQSPGRYTVVVRGQAGCEARLVDALTVVSSVGPGALRLSPSSVRPGAPSSLSLELMAAGQFGAHPYVTFVDAAAPAQAIAAVGATPASPTQLEVAAPALAAGRHVVTVFSDAGVFAGSLEVTTLTPPEVVALEPPHVPPTGLQQVTAVGHDFRQPRVTLRCAYASGVLLPRQPQATVLSADATHVTARFDGAAAGASCLVRIENGDGTSAERWLAITDDGSQPLRQSLPGPTLAQGRDAPVALVGDEPLTWLRVVGGAAGVPLDTVESARITLGLPGPFITEHARLSSARAGAGGVVVGEVLYVVGGRAEDGGVLDTIERARPLALPGAPAPTLSLDVATGGLDAGAWSYRVSPLLANGEEGVSWGPLLARAPALNGRGVAVTLAWAAQPGVTAWRVYRSPTGEGAVVGTERLLAQVPASTTAFVDTGLQVVSPQTPLLPGALGPWEVLPARLATPREGVAAAWALDPGDPTQGYLFVLGGRTASGQVSAEVERLTVTLASDGTQAAAATFVSALAPLSQPRAELAAAVATRASSSRVPAGRALLYAGGALTEGAEVLPGGALGPWLASPQAGAGLVVGFDAVMVLGDSLAPDGVWWAPLCGVGVTGCSASAPALGVWAARPALLQPRVGLAATRSGPFVFVVGGHTAAGLLRLTEVRTW